MKKMRRFAAILIVVITFVILMSSCNSYVCPAYVQDNIELENGNG